MSYQRLMDDHQAIDTLIAELLAIAGGAPQPTLASLVLARLAAGVRDHRVAEDAILSETLGAATGNRHALAAVAAMRDLEEVEEAWTLYLYRWSPRAIAADWSAFSEQTQSLMSAIRLELAREAGILYSLAVHYHLLATTG